MGENSWIGGHREHAVGSDHHGEAATRFTSPSSRPGNVAGTPFLGPDTIAAR